MTSRPGQGAPGLRVVRRGDSADQFRVMADFAPVMIWLTAPDRKAVYFNRPWLEFTGRPLASELGHGWKEGIHTEDRARCEASIEEAFVAHQPYEIEYRLRRGDGEYRWVRDKGVPILPDARLVGFVGSCLDITDQLAAEREARQRAEDFKTLAENIPDVIVRVDRNLRCLYANPALAATFGPRPSAIVGKRRAQWKLPERVSEALAEAATRTFATSREQRYSFVDERAGERRHFAGRAIPESSVGNGVDAVLLITYDVTARAQETEESAEALERERSARAQAESATLARDQFLAMVSHELRSPLNGIKSWTHVLENQLHDADDTTQRAIDGIMIGVEHQVRLIEDLLDVTRAMSGNLGLMKEPMTVMPCLMEAVESLRASAMEKELRLLTDYGTGEGEIHGDPDRVRQIFVNLVTNAIKFTPPGGTISISTGVQGSMMRIEVRDDGAGIAPDFLPYVFDPFRQADQAPRNRRQQGLGLGLALVQRLVHLHGGDVSCESAGAGRGTTFTVLLPVARGSHTTIAASANARALASLPSLSGIDVLVVDDQREARESVAALLQQAGARVEVAESGQQALQRLAARAADDRPQIVVCDIGMPGEDGYATLKRLRAWEAANGRARRPAIALSAFTQREERMRALSEGFQAYLTKPVAAAELMLVIASIARGMRV